MRYTARQYAFALYQAVSEAGPKEQDKIIENFAEVLKINGDLGMTDEIEAEFRTIDREAKGIKLAEVTTAHTLSREEEKALVEKLNTYVKGEVELKKKVDAGVIGGVMVKIGDELMDGTVRGELNQLKGKLSQ